MPSAVSETGASDRVGSISIPPTGTLDDHGPRFRRAVGRRRLPQGLMARSLGPCDLGFVEAKPAEGDDAKRQGHRQKHSDRGRHATKSLAVEDDRPEPT